MDWALFVKKIACRYEDAEKITLVMDNLNTHTPGSLYEAFAPEKAKVLWDRFEFVYTPKHGIWLNMAMIELNVLIGFLAPQMEQYIEYRQSLGSTAVNRLKLFDRYLVMENVTMLKVLTPLFFLKMLKDLEIDQNTKNRVIDGLRGFFQYLVRIECCQANLLTGVPRFKRNNIIPFIF